MTITVEDRTKPATTQKAANAEDILRISVAVGDRVTQFWHAWQAYNLCVQKSVSHLKNGRPKMFRFMMLTAEMGLNEAYENLMAGLKQLWAVTEADRCEILDGLRQQLYKAGEGALLEAVGEDSED